MKRYGDVVWIQKFFVADVETFVTVHIPTYVMVILVNVSVMNLIMKKFVSVTKSAILLKN